MWRFGFLLAAVILFVLAALGVGQKWEVLILPLALACMALSFMTWPGRTAPPPT